MDQASTPPANASVLSEVSDGLFELEGPLLRIRDLLIAVTMMAESPDLSKEAGNALNALADTMLHEVREVLEERTRLCHLARGRLP